MLLRGHVLFVCDSFLSGERLRHFVSAEIFFYRVLLPRSNNFDNGNNNDNTYNDKDKDSGGDKNDYDKNNEDNDND